jgi:hypothetical protein
MEIRFDRLLYERDASPLFTKYTPPLNDLVNTVITVQMTYLNLQQSILSVQ